MVTRFENRPVSTKSEHALREGVEPVAFIAYIQMLFGDRQLFGYKPKSREELGYRKKAAPQVQRELATAPAMPFETKQQDFEPYKPKSREAKGYRSRLSKAEQEEVNKDAQYLVVGSVVIEPHRGNKKSYDLYR